MLSDFIAAIKKIDQALFLNINGSNHPKWLDTCMLFLRNQNTWIPLYIILLLVVFKLKKDKLLLFIVLSILVFGLTDYISASILKPFFSRLRPCHIDAISSKMNVLIGCGGKYSFPSSHAANHFGLATIWFNVIAYWCNKKWFWVWPWASVICYAQIYVGKHFPIDIAFGALLGICIGGLIFSLYTIFVQRRFKKTSFQTVQNTQTIAFND
jgi:undecaprenyl-diphosphatase